MARPQTDEQMMLIDLPTVPATPGVPAPVRRRAAPTATRLAAPPLDPFAPVPDAVPGIMLVDPRFVAVDPINARHGLVFDAQAQAELITSMRLAGNTVPVRLRANPAGGYLCPSGSQRLGSALHIQRDQPTFRLRAIIADAMDDREAFALGEADNAGRTGVAPLQQARKWAEALDTLYSGDRQAFIAATGRSASMVSRTLALAMLPEHILACCSNVEALTTYFAEQLAPRLADPAEEPEVRRRADMMIAAGRRLPAAKLIRALLQDEPASVCKPQTLWQSPDGSRHIRFRAAKEGGRIDLTHLAGVSAAERRNLVKAFDTLLKRLVTAEPTR
ncbi:MAG: hypothetical protein ABI240_08845 [Sphingomonas sp.]